MIELFGERVLALLTERGMTQRELAEAAGLTEVTISRYMTGLRKPKSDNVVAIAEVLGVTTDYLLRGKRDAQQWLPGELMVISAVRYALGRMSYIVSVTCEFVATNRKRLSQNCIDIIIRDIEEAFEMYHRSGHLMGMECDEADWNRLLSVLKGGDRDETD